MGHREYTPKEDAVIRKYAGLMTAEGIGLMIGRPKGGVNHRISKLGLNGHLYGDDHWNSKVDSLIVAMIHTLYDAGFTPTEIQRVISESHEISHRYVSDISCARYRQRG